ncbi:MAG: dTDP-4-dehydrorhamnose 3,5-epimerase [Beijerinckiaceae bacterium]
MEVQAFALSDLLLFTPKRHGDDRGVFAEVFREDVFQAHVPGMRLVQDNHSVSVLKGTIRGLHYQKSPRAQGKLVRVVRGSILDVAVDARSGSPTFGQHVAVTLSAENWQQLWIPAGFLHGFCSLSDGAEVLYKVSDTYSAAHDAAVLWNDPALGIAWPVTEDAAIVSEKDRKAPLFRDMGEVFA